MCTVTYIPSGDTVFLTSNRDEKIARGGAEFPKTYSFSTGEMLFPKDQKGGTWIAAHENGNALVLLNGAFLSHIPTPPYRKSRGLILLDLADSPTPYNSFLAINLSGIEPFTLIILDDGKLFECRWDGNRKHEKSLPADAAHIWSSSTLYNSMVMEKRETWFSAWLDKNPSPSLKDILHFHQFTGDGDQANDLRMSRDGILCTVSISSICIRDQHSMMTYFDMITREESITELPHIYSTVGR